MNFMNGEMKHNIDKIFLISDIHFGIRNSNQEWADIQEDYFYNWFIPLIEKEKTETSAVFMLGDIFENRTSLNIKTLDTSIKIIKEISSQVPVHIIVGNHDSYNKSQNDINSLKIFNFLDNVFVYEEPKMLKLENEKSIYLMPWRSTYEIEKETIENINSDYLFCHTSYSGSYSNRVSKSPDGNSVEVFNKFKRVYSGHIHFRQEKDNIILIGSPYSMTKNDIDNQKGIYILNLNKDTHVFIENNHSPKFLRYDLSDLLNIQFKKYKEMVVNNFLDIVVPQKHALTFPFTDLMNITDTYRKFNLIIGEDDIQSDDTLEEELSEFDIIRLADQHIESLPYTEKIKSLLKDYVKNLYRRLGGLEEDDEDN